MPPASVRVLLVGDPDESLTTALSAAAELRPMRSASSPRDVIVVLSELRPDVTLVDLDFPAGTVAALPSLQSAAPGTRIIAITDVADQARHAAALFAGARGLIRKHQLADLLPRAIPKILAGELWFERQLVASAVLAMHAAKRRLDEQGDRRAWLPPRRRDMLALCGGGLSDDEIAARLSLPPGAVRTQVAALTKKLGLASRLELIAYVHQSGAMSTPGPR